MLRMVFVIKEVNDEINEKLILIKRMMRQALLTGNRCRCYFPTTTTAPTIKTTKTVVGLRLSNRWEPPTKGTQNYMIEQKESKTQKKKLLVYIRRPQNSF